MLRMKATCCNAFILVILGWKSKRLILQRASRCAEINKETQIMGMLIVVLLLQIAEHVLAIIEALIRH